jgi:hypothetical protein
VWRGAAEQREQRERRVVVDRRATLTLLSLEIGRIERGWTDEAQGRG